jgi:hypothetical protein
VDIALESAEGSLGLYDPGAVEMDRVNYGSEPEGVSEGRLPDGDALIVAFPESASPGASNFLPLPGARINEVLTHTDPPLEDAIELHNPTGQAVNIGGWYLSDDLEELKKYRIADGTLLLPGQYQVFYEYQFNGGPGSLTPFLLDSVRGESVYLSATDAGGDLTGYRDSARFGAAANGVSLGRYETSVGEDFVALSARTFGVDDPATLTAFRGGTGLPNAYPRVGPVVISEIMYRPVIEGDPDPVELAGLEFIELRNITGEAVPLYDLAHATNTWRFTDGIQFDFPIGSNLAPHGHLLVAGFDPINQPAALEAFRIRYSVPEAVPLFGPFLGRLDNAGETIVLSRPDRPQQAPQPDAGYVPYIEVERMNYLPRMPWPVLSMGDSLQRISASSYGNDPANWVAAIPSAGSPNAPGALRLAFAGFTEDGVRLSWTSEPGATYGVEFTEDLGLLNWQAIGAPVMATGAVTVAVVPAGAMMGGRYFRIVLSE